MPSVGCNVNNCSYNNGGICYSNKISINGKKARTSNNTCCSSFINESNSNSLSNSVNYGPCNSVGCNVKTCAHNAAGSVCALHDVAINSNVDNANLYSETYCNSFRCK